MRALIIDEEAKKAIAVVKEYAELNRYPRYKMIQLMNQQLRPCGDDPGHVCHLQQGYRIVYSIEEQPKGWSHHLSISVDNPDKCPSIESVEVIMGLFGFMQKSLDECYCWLEDEIKPSAVNVLALVDGPSCGSGTVPAKDG